jgi:UDP-N-acetylmuramate--alanine ligase
MDADHLDIYGDEAHIRAAFKEFASQVSGIVIAKYGIDITPADTQAKIMTYSFGDPRADFYAEPVGDEGHFNLHYPGGVIEDCVVGIPGWVNIENATGASAIGLAYGLDPQKIKAALATFSGVKRRFDLQVRRPDCVYIDDYAHHPEEISAALSSIKKAYPSMKLTAAFQPHLYTRTRDFAEEFAQALSNVDKLILLEIYPAREEPIPGVTSEIIFKDVTAPEKVLLKRADFMEYMEKEEVELFVTLGAGDIDRFVGPIAEMLSQRK